MPNAYIVGSTDKSTPDIKTLKNGRKTDSNNYRASGGEWNVYHDGSKTQNIENPLNPNSAEIKKDD